MNKHIGNSTEDAFAQVLRANGYWCHIFAHNKNGQPFDIIAVKNNRAFLFDVKHCDGDAFYFRNIQPNQKTSFEYAKNKGNTNTGFAIYFQKENKFKLLTYEHMIQLENNGEIKVKRSELKECTL